MRTLESEVRQWPTPAVIQEGRKRDPFKILISCLISLRTRDEVTRLASKRLFALADNPKNLLAQPLAAIEEAIYPAAFWASAFPSVGLPLMLTEAVVWAGARPLIAP